MWLLISDSEFLTKLTVRVSSEQMSKEHGDGDGDGGAAANSFTSH